MKIYIIEDEKFGVTGAFLHEAAADQALDLDTDGLLCPSKSSVRILEVEVNTSKAVFDYRPATYTGEIKNK